MFVSSTTFVPANMAMLANVAVLANMATLANTRGRNNDVEAIGTQDTCETRPIAKMVILGGSGMEAGPGPKWPNRCFGMVWGVGNGFP